MQHLVWGWSRIGTIALLAALVLSACHKTEPRTPQAAKAGDNRAQQTAARTACASQAAYERLKALAFEKAKTIRAGDAATLDRLAAAAVVRMDDAAVEGRDDALNVTVCKGRMVIDLPPGFEDAFNGDRQLSADVKYAVQATSNGIARAYPLRGAEPIVYRLAAIDLKSGLRVAQNKPPPVVEAAESVAPPPAAAPPRRRSAALEPRLAARGRPSFDCRDMRSRAERMLCGDERLAAYDRVAASLYGRAFDDSDRDTRAVLLGTQDRFLARRERCRSPACIVAAYRDRMDEIDRIAAGG
ncbi:hypothetical protein SCH01S_52_01050 [Sphingomonas changbaiensis NBRC 104936]|uniref:Lysozyme inhibitor LprI N-terminal domain-containing protein n=1 Tax=Sphingomonas changbaiensis NBRC 104936 TaxID=1219043 RepID=A0A0E9MT45_9SPHN|nr:hypothetical protein [Sphingomonas changbaiensis]GAO40922.1 hypothetical protein SCH01S_52_01050 [Sphingomonas changbaiensis NBRC 104936]